MTAEGIVPRDVRPSAERLRYHQLIEKFKAMIEPGGLVYDIGKSSLYDYHNAFKNYVYQSIDADAKKEPDIVMELGNTPIDSTLSKADGVLCNGVTEQCQNPYRLVSALNQLLKPGAAVLMGIISIGYPPYDNDRVRFTPNGASCLMINYGFHVEHIDVVDRDGKPSYVFLICRKTE